MTVLGWTFLGNCRLVVNYFIANFFWQPILLFTEIYCFRSISLTDYVFWEFESTME